MSNPSDNFNGLRLVAASLVLVGHVVKEYDPRGALISHPGLLMLFAISGYLCAGSWRSDPHFWRFLARRFFRIWPAYAAMVAICAAIAYRSMPEAALAFLRSLWFEYHPVGINGSIWMMPIEMSLYLLLALAGAATLPSLLALGGLVCWMTSFFTIGWADFGVFFVAGVLLQAYPAVVRHAPLFVLCGGMALAAGLLELGYLLAIPAGAVWVGGRIWPVLSAAARWGDLSYGVFLWHAPLLHFIVMPLGVGPWFGTLATAALSGVSALASWHLIERRALRLKPRAIALRNQVTSPCKTHDVLSTR